MIYEYFRIKQNSRVNRGNRRFGARICPRESKPNRNRRKNARYDKRTVKIL